MDSYYAKQRAWIQHVEEMERQEARAEKAERDRMFNPLKEEDPDEARKKYFESSEGRRFNEANYTPIEKADISPEARDQLQKQYGDKVKAVFRVPTGKIDFQSLIEPMLHEQLGVRNIATNARLAEAYCAEYPRELHSVSVAEIVTAKQADCFVKCSPDMSCPETGYLSEESVAMLRERLGNLVTNEGLDNIRRYFCSAGEVDRDLALTYLCTELKMDPTIASAALTKWREGNEKGARKALADCGLEEEDLELVADKLNLKGPINTAAIKEVSSSIFHIPKEKIPPPGAVRTVQRTRARSAVAAMRIIIPIDCFDLQSSTHYLAFLIRHLVCGTAEAAAPIEVPARPFRNDKGVVESEADAAVLLEPDRSGVKLVAKATDPRWLRFRDPEIVLEYWIDPVANAQGTYIVYVGWTTRYNARDDKLIVVSY